MADPNSPLIRFRVWLTNLPPALRLFLSLNIALYVTFVILNVVGAGGVLQVLALPTDPGGLVTRPWAVLTHAVTNLYPGLFGLISFVFAMLWLNWMGRDFEETYGSHQFFALYVFSALAGAALAMFLLALSPSEHFFLSGAWGPAVAVLCAMATIHPDREMGLFLLGMIPLKWIAIGCVALDLAFVQDPTHLGAAAAGAGLGMLQKRHVAFGAWARVFFRNGISGRAPKADFGQVGAWLRKRREGAGGTRSSAMRHGSGEAPAVSGAAEVDRILDKIIESGYDSLTDAEKRTLDEASRE